MKSAVVWLASWAACAHQARHVLQDKVSCAGRIQHVAPLTLRLRLDSALFRCETLAFSSPNLCCLEEQRSTLDRAQNLILLLPHGSILATLTTGIGDRAISVYQVYSQYVQGQDKWGLHLLKKFMGKQYRLRDRL